MLKCLFEMDELGLFSSEVDGGGVLRQRRENEMCFPHFFGSERETQPTRPKAR